MTVSQTSVSEAFGKRETDFIFLFLFNFFYLGDIPAPGEGHTLGGPRWKRMWPLRVPAPRSVPLPAPSKPPPLSLPSSRPGTAPRGAEEPSSAGVGWGYTAPPRGHAAVPGAQPSASDTPKAMVPEGRGQERRGEDRGGGGGRPRGCRAGDGDARNLLFGLDKGLAFPGFPEETAAFSLFIRNPFPCV